MQAQAANPPGAAATAPAPAGATPSTRPEPPADMKAFNAAMGKPVAERIRHCSSS